MYSKNLVSQISLAPQCHLQKLHKAGFSCPKRTSANSVHCKFIKCKVCYPAMSESQNHTV